MHDPNLPDDVSDDDPRAPWNEPDCPEFTCKQCGSVWDSPDEPGKGWYLDSVEAIDGEEPLAPQLKVNECPACNPELRDGYMDNCDLADKYHKERRE